MATTAGAVDDRPLREPGRCDESVSLGHADIAMGRLDEARAVLARLRPLDPREAEELDEAIAKAARR